MKINATVEKVPIFNDASLIREKATEKHGSTFGAILGFFLYNKVHIFTMHISSKIKLL